jgi:hypothetical protein
MLRRRLLTTAVSLLIAVAGSTPIAAQSQSDSTGAAGRSQGWKDPSLAGLLGVLHPGLGHYYVGDWARGRRVQFRALSAITMGLALVVIGGAGGVCQAPCDAEWALIGVGAGAVAVGFGVWGYGAVDAWRAAGRANAARRTGLRLSATPNRSRAGISATLTFSRTVP